VPRRHSSRPVSGAERPQTSEDAPPFGRHATITRALFQLRGLQPGPATIVETGTLRNDTPSGLSGDGWSTMAWGWYCRRYGGKVTTVDVSAENLAVCRRVTGRYADVIEYVEGDSVAFLRRWDRPQRGPIHLLYLDSMDYLPHQREQSEEHHRAEAEAALPALAAGCLVLIDDTSPAGEPEESGVPVLTGKGARAVPFLLERRFRLEWCLEN
jgi:methyltransferase family protein